MAVAISLDRKAVQVTWTEGLDYTGEVQLFFTRGDDVSNTDPRANDGDATVSVPSNFTGTTHVQVLTVPDKNVLDEGDLTL